MWKYIDESNPEVPSRHIRWEFKIPFVLKLDGSLFWKGWSVGGRFLIFGFDYITDVHCDKNKVRIGLQKWFIHASMFNGWCFTLFFGVAYLEYMTWRIKRMDKKAARRFVPKL